ncbi:MAG: type III-A CRISPR-associated RAMP protein Csm3 [Candidatus Micrarchaeaceae archaeon]
MGEIKRLIKNIIIEGKITVITGLHIGGLSDSVKIGGIDTPVITTFKKVQGELIPIPFIPGSSLKGKIRNLLTSFYSSVPEKNDLIKNIFGVPMEEKKKGVFTVTRALFRDAYPDDAYLKDRDTIESITEVKGENKIDPITIEATPRFIQRVVPDTVFNYQIVLSVFEGDDAEAMKSLLKEGFRLLKDSYLGGNGSRGYGRIDYTFEIKGEHSLKYYEDQAQGI